jgi:hypothetical protein
VQSVPEVSAVVRSRAEAVTHGLPRFQTGRACRAGHHAERFASNGQCVRCNALSARQREARRCYEDPSYRMFRSVLRRTGMALAGRGRPAEYVGCDHPQLRDFIASRFGEGMTWDRYRQWEVDHVLPLGGVHDLDALLQRCHFTNLQPLWRSDNRRKGGA